MEYQVTSDAEWLTLVETKAAHTEKLRFSYALNTGADARTANIKITGAAGDVIDVTVLQAGCPPLKASYEIGEYYERQGVIGIVWHFDENYVKVLALDEKAGVEFAGNSFANSWADSKTDGLANLNAILNQPVQSVSYFPHRNCAMTKVPAGTFLLSTR